MIIMMAWCSAIGAAAAFAMWFAVSKLHVHNWDIHNTPNLSGEDEIGKQKAKELEAHNVQELERLYREMGRR